MSDQGERLGPVRFRPRPDLVKVPHPATAQRPDGYRSWEALTVRKVTEDPKNRAERLLSVTDTWFPFTINPTAVTTEQLALAGLVRCLRLLKGMIQVHDAPDLAGLFARTLYETYLNTLYLFLGGDAAYKRLEAKDDCERRRIAKRFLKSSDPADPIGADLRTQSKLVMASPEPQGKQIDTAAVGREVRRLLLAMNDPNAEWPVTMYSYLFGPESYTSVHGGLGAIKQYMMENGQMTDRISADPWHHAGNDHRLDLMTAAVLTLAHKVGKTFGLPVALLDEMAQDLNEDQDGLTEEGESL